MAGGPGAAAAIAAVVSGFATKKSSGRGAAAGASGRPRFSALPSPSSRRLAAGGGGAPPTSADGANPDVDGAACGDADRGSKPIVECDTSPPGAGGGAPKPTAGEVPAIRLSSAAKRSAELASAPTLVSIALEPWIACLAAQFST